MEQAPFGEVLRRLRIQAGFTQQELAERAGLSVRGLSDLERGVRRTPRPATLRLLLGALNLQGRDRQRLLEARVDPRTRRVRTAAPGELGDYPSRTTFRRQAAP